MKFIQDQDKNSTTVAFDYSEVESGGIQVIGVIYDANGVFLGVEVSLPYFYGGHTYQMHIGGDVSPFYWNPKNPNDGSYSIPGGYKIYIPTQKLVPSKNVLVFPTVVKWERHHLHAPWNPEPEMAGFWSSTHKESTLEWLKSQVTVTSSSPVT